MACGNKGTKEHMKEHGVIQSMKKIQTDNPSRDDVKQAAQRVIDALNREEISIDLHVYETPKFEHRKQVEKLRDDDKGPVMHLPKEIRNLLNAGCLMIKHSNTAQPRKKHVYVDHELKRLIWKDPHDKKIEEKNTMKVGMIKSIEKGNCTPQLQRVTLIGKKPLSKDECSFAIFGRQRTVDLECTSTEERDKWVHALEVLVEFTRGKKVAARGFGNR